MKWMHQFGIGFELMPSVLATVDYCTDAGQSSKAESSYAFKSFFPYRKPEDHQSNFYT